jgi:transcription initiation factor TFIID TATA-box-binding protein
VCQNIEYAPRRSMNFALLRLPKLKVTGLLFSSGRLVVSGAKSEVAARIATRFIARIIQTMGHPKINYQNFEFVNVTSLFDTKFTLDLKGFISRVTESKAVMSKGGLSQLCNYRHSSDCSMVISQHGKIIIKSPSPKVACEAIQSVYPILLESCAMVNTR